MWVQFLYWFFGGIKIVKTPIYQGLLYRKKIEIIGSVDNGPPLDPDYSKGILWT